MIKRLLLVFSITTILLAVPGLANAQAQTNGDFSLQVTPSPLVSNLKPGQPTELELKIRNGGTQTEQLKIEPRSFSIDPASERVKLNDTAPPEITPWLSFSAPNFTIQPGQWFTQKVRVALPKDAGFSYSFALLISRKQNPKPTEGGRLIKGSLAIFTLVNVDRPGAKRKLDIGSFQIGKHMYEYLPADLSIKLTNSGNTIVQPYGNIFVQRGSNDKTPITTQPVNPTKGYLLPSSTRTFKTTWNDGFPYYKTTSDESGHSQRHLVWDWSKVANLRIGRYTAKLVAVYNDGQRDVPLESQVSFWVVPWKILIGLFVILLLMLFGLYSLTRQIIRLIRHKK